MTGGYVCGPVAVACSLRKVPVLIYLPDITPGYAIRWLSKLAQRVAVTLPEVAQHFGGEAPQGKAVVTGYPVRQELVEAATGSRDAPGGRLAEALQWPQRKRCRIAIVVGVGRQPGRTGDQPGDLGKRGKTGATSARLARGGERDWPLYEQWAQATRCRSTWPIGITRWLICTKTMPLGDWRRRT